jgi:hypothetical protein
MTWGRWWLLVAAHTSTLDLFWCSISNCLKGPSENMLWQYVIIHHVIIYHVVIHHVIIHHVIIHHVIIHHVVIHHVIIHHVIIHHVIIHHVVIHHAIIIFIYKYLGKYCDKGSSHNCNDSNMTFPWASDVLAAPNLEFLVPRTHRAICRHWQMCHGAAGGNQIHIGIWWFINSLLQGLTRLDGY